MYLFLFIYLHIFIYICLFWFIYLYIFIFNFFEKQFGVVVFCRIICFVRMVSKLVVDVCDIAKHFIYLVYRRIESRENPRQGWPLVDRVEGGGNSEKGRLPGLRLFYGVHRINRECAQRKCLTNLFFFFFFERCNSVGRESLLPR